MLVEDLVARRKATVATMTETMTLDECISTARETLIEQAQYDRDFLAGMSRYKLADWLDERMSESVDSAVPIYYSDIFAVLVDPRVWSQAVSEYGQTKDMSEAAQIAIYMAIEEALRDGDSLLDEIEAIARGV